MLLTAPPTTPFPSFASDVVDCSATTLPINNETFPTAFQMLSGSPSVHIDNLALPGLLLRPSCWSILDFSWSRHFSRLILTEIKSFPLNTKRLQPLLHISLPIYPHISRLIHRCIAVNRHCFQPSQLINRWIPSRSRTRFPFTISSLNGHSLNANTACDSIIACWIFIPDMQFSYINLNVISKGA